MNGRPSPNVGSSNKYSDHHHHGLDKRSPDRLRLCCVRIDFWQFLLLSSTNFAAFFPQTHFVGGFVLRTWKSSYENSSGSIVWDVLILGSTLYPSYPSSELQAIPTYPIVGSILLLSSSHGARYHLFISQTFCWVQVSKAMPKSHAAVPAIVQPSHFCIISLCWAASCPISATSALLVMILASIWLAAAILKRDSWGHEINDFYDSWWISTRFHGIQWIFDVMWWDFNRISWEFMTFNVIWGTHLDWMGFKGSLGIKCGLNHQKCKKWRSCGDWETSASSCSENYRWWSDEQLYMCFNVVHW